jgi:hypothetical protein
LIISSSNRVLKKNILNKWSGDKINGDKINIKNILFLK